MPSGTAENKYRTAIDILMSGRDVLIGSLADEILDQAENLIEGGFLYNEFLESQGTRLHFLGLMVAQLEQSADTFDEALYEPPPPPPAPAPKKRKPRVKKLTPQQASSDIKPDDL